MSTPYQTTTTLDPIPAPSWPPPYASWVEAMNRLEAHRAPVTYVVGRSGESYDPDHRARLNPPEKLWPTLILPPHSMEAIVLGASRVGPDELVFLGKNPSGYWFRCDVVRASAGDP